MLCDTDTSSDVTEFTCYTSLRLHKATTVHIQRHIFRITEQLNNTLLLQYYYTVCVSIWIPQVSGFTWCHTHAEDCLSGKLYLLQQTHNCSATFRPFVVLYEFWHAATSLFIFAVSLRTCCRHFVGVFYTVLCLSDDSFHLFLLLLAVVVI